MTERFLVWGAGGHGKVIADLIRSVGGTVVGFADRDIEKGGMVVEPGGGTVVVDESRLIHAIVDGRALPCNANALALGIGENVARLACLARAGRTSIPALVHPRSTVSEYSHLGRGTVVFAGAVVNSEARLGEGVIVNSGSIVEHDCVLDDGVHVAPGSVLTGGVRVGRATLVGARSVVLPGVVVGEDVTIGAGSVVTRDVASGVAVAGNPAKPIRRRVHASE